LFDLQDPDSKVTYQKISEVLFPHHFHAQTDNGLEKDDVHVEEMKRKFEGQDREEVVMKRLRDLESMLKIRFSTTWATVKAAFLALDADHDGIITITDFMRVLQSESDKINLRDLKKLIRDKDSKGAGSLNYTDFSEWLGQAIHWSEGFYFRHDSIKNPAFEKNCAKYDK
jgi:Ca2+-binding EF-hand superfamily protein